MTTPTTVTTPIAPEKAKGKKTKGSKLVKLTTIETPTPTPSSSNQEQTTISTYNPLGGSCGSGETLQGNVILHLRCSTLVYGNENDNYNGNYNDNNIDSNTDSNKQKSTMSENVQSNQHTDISCTPPHHHHKPSIDVNDIHWTTNPPPQSLSVKIKILEMQLHTNTCQNPQPACFWCTECFNSTPVYIPKFTIKESGTEIFNVYGNFCSPECAAGYLMNERIDTSIKFERYALLNHLYGKIFNYMKNIIPAPNPYYTLEKYCGNLTIDEYRGLQNTNRQLFIVNKPLIKFMPELQQETVGVGSYNRLLSKDGSAFGVCTTTFIPLPPPNEQHKNNFKALFTPS
jgi:hypothetical protein